LVQETDQELAQVQVQEKAQALAQALVLVEEKVEVLESGWVQLELPLEWEKE
jgi:hypothetical protein